MDDEDEFETYFRRASERAPVKQMSQQHSPVSSTTTMKHRRASLQVRVRVRRASLLSTQACQSAGLGLGMPVCSQHRRASLQAPDVMCSIQSASTRSSRSTSPSPETPTRHSGRRRSRRDADKRASSSTSTTTVTEHPDQWQSPGSRSRRRQRSQMTSYVSSPTTAVSRLFKPRSLPAAARTAYQGQERRHITRGWTEDCSPRSTSYVGRRLAADPAVIRGD